MASLQDVDTKALLQAVAHLSSLLQNNEPAQVLCHTIASAAAHKARLSVVHAGALLWHMGRCLTGGFLEPFALHMATLVLWAYSASPQLPTTDEA